MRSTATPYRHEGRGTPRVPVVLPVVDVTVDEAGCLSVMLDHEAYSVDELHRSDLRRVVDQIATELGTPVRVQVQERDGSTFTDIVSPTAVAKNGSEPVQKQTMTNADARALSVCAGHVSGDGFLPDEDVAVAVVVAHQVANADGEAKLRLPPALLAAHPGLIVLMGQTSGAVRVSESAT